MLARCVPFALVLLLGSTSAARAEMLSIAPGDNCKRPAADKVIRLPQWRDASIRDVVMWAASTVCQGFRISAEHAARRVTVQAPVPMPLTEARHVLTATLAAATLKIRLARSGPEVVADRRKSRRKATKAPKGAPSLPLTSALIATVVGPDPGRNAAVFRDAKGRQKVYAIGQRLAGDRATLLGVEPHQVYLRHGKKLGVVGFQEGEAPPPATTSLGGVDLRPLIKAAGKRRWEVTKRAAALALADPDRTLRLVTIKPERRDGKIYGWRVTGFREDSLPGLLGARSGDILVALNGRALGDPEQVLAIYLTLKMAKRIVVTVDRKGTRINLEYIIR